VRLGHDPGAGDVVARQGAGEPHRARLGDEHCVFKGHKAKNLNVAQRVDDFRAGELLAGRQRRVGIYRAPRGGTRIRLPVQLARRTRRVIVAATVVGGGFPLRICGGRHWKAREERFSGVIGVTGAEGAGENERPNDREVPQGPLHHSGLRVSHRNREAKPGGKVNGPI